MTRYSRQDLLRILHLQARHLQAWEREGLFPNLSEGEQYSFEHLSRLRALRELKSRRMSARSIRTQVEAMQKVAGMRNVLAELSAVPRGSRLAFRTGGTLLDPSTQQLAFDFAASREQRLHVVCPRLAAAQTLVQEAAQLQELFARAVQLEEKESTLDEAIALYEQILTVRQDHAPACINLGTIFYNRRDFDRAERMYRAATEADPRYALAFFDLGNVLDEVQRLDDAIAAYSRAVELVPGYADAHYNLALAYERKSERRRALRHWMAYVRLDPVGPWAAHAREQAQRILARERLTLVRRASDRATA